jgi:hypothetical protein
MYVANAPHPNHLNALPLTHLAGGISVLRGRKIPIAGRRQKMAH